MATSAHSTFARQSPLVQMMAHSALKTSQAAALVVPPIYILSSLVRRRGLGFSISGLLRASTRGVVLGAPVGAVAAWGRLRNEPVEAVEDRCFRLANSASQIQVDDYSLIGASLGAVLVPAILLRRASFLTLAAGGASLGLGAGTAMHIAQMFGQGEKVKPEGMVGEIPVVGGNPK